MRVSILLTITCVLSLSNASGQQLAKTILGIFPHPDDENMIGDVFAKYARLGHKVYVIIATDGKYGTSVTMIPTGDSLGMIRQMESSCACEKLCIKPPIYLHIDRLDTKFGVRSYLGGHKKLLEELEKHITQLQPDILITFGPDGEYGHSEHIVTGATVIDLLLRKGWVDKYPLYFPIEKKEDNLNESENGYVDESYINGIITYSQEDENKSFEAAKCYVSQTTSEEIKEHVETKSANKTNAKYFRRFSILKGVKNEFEFEK